MKKLFLLGALLPALALAQSVSISGPNGAGSRGTAGVTTTYGLAVDVTRTPSTQDTTSGPTNLTAACATPTAACSAGQFASIALAGQTGAGVTFTTGCTATIAADLSFDGGTTWTATYFDTPSTFAKPATVANPATASVYTIVGAGGASHARVRVAAYTSTCTVALRASDVNDPSVLFAGPFDNAVVPPAGAMVMSLSSADGTTTDSFAAGLSSRTPGTWAGVQQTAGNTGHFHADHDGRVLVRSTHPNIGWATSGVSTATTLTQLIAAAPASNSIYITDLTFSATVASTATADQQMTLKQGTGASCGTGTTYVWGAFGPAMGGVAISFATPLKLATANGLCFIHAVAGSKIVNVNYYIAP